MKKSFLATTLLSPLMIIILMITFGCSKKGSVYVRLLTDFQEIKDLPHNYVTTEYETVFEMGFLAQEIDSGELLFLVSNISEPPPFSKADILNVKIKKVRYPFNPNSVLRDNVFAPVSTVIEGVKYFQKKVQLWEIMEAKPAMAEKNEKLEVKK